MVALDGGQRRTTLKSKVSTFGALRGEVRGWWYEQTYAKAIYHSLSFSALSAHRFWFLSAHIVCFSQLDSQCVGEHLFRSYLTELSEHLAIH